MIYTAGAKEWSDVFPHLISGKPLVFWLKVLQFGYKIFLES